jgi:single-strand DNA-binding protein
MSSRLPINGRLVRDPELRFTNQGKAVASFTVVTCRKYKDDQGVWQEVDTSFWDVTAFGDMAENICESLQKGTAVIVTGAMRQESWKDKEGQNRTSWKVNADDVAVSVKWKKIADLGGGSGASFSDEPPF